MLALLGGYSAPAQVNEPVYADSLLNGWQNYGWASLIYVDDSQLTPQAPPPIVHVSLNATQMVRAVDARFFAVNTAIWDGAFDTPATVALLRAMGCLALRFPGGSASDDYHWASNTSGTNTWTWATSFTRFAHVATNLGAQVIITANYGGGTPQKAAAWVRFANVTNHYGFKYWEIGNENYGTWELDTNLFPHDPFTYATRAKDYLTQMKAADPTVKIGVVAVTGEDSYSNNYTNHPATNPRTGKSHNGWTPVLLTTLKNEGVTPDFLIYHRYAQAPGTENDQNLLQSSRTWPNDAADLRQQLIDYLGPANTNVELVCTENNSVYTNPGKQSTSLVNGLFLADSIAQALQTGFNGLVWWDLRNGQDSKQNNSPALYGWRQYGDYGVVSPGNDRYPTYYVARLLQYFARGGDAIIRATSDSSFLAAYAARRTNGTISLLVLNKSASNSFNASISLAGYPPHTNALVYSYGIAQDDAARTGIGSPDLVQTNFPAAGTNFTFTFPPYSATVLSFAPGPPRLLISPGALRADGLHFQIQGLAGLRYIAQTSSNLLNWVSITTNLFTNAVLDFTDAQATKRQLGFYRALWAP